LIDGGAPTGAAAFDVVSRAATAFFCGSVAADGAGGFGLAWAGSAGAAAYELHFAHVTSGGAVDASGTLLSTPRPIAVAALARTPDAFALLYNVAGSSAYLALVGTDGKPTGPARLLGGASSGWGLAANGASLGVVARRQAGVAFRPLSAAGQASGDWVCLDGASDDRDQTAAIDADGAGFAVVYRSPARIETLARFDATGTGP
jgi:hypothetical protein